MSQQTITGGVRTGGGIAALGAALGAAYLLVIRRWFLHWGAGAEEIARAWPGDELVPAPKVSATHAVTIAATPAEVWHWLLQLGQGRGGFYSYEWIENLLGADIHNTDRILPEWQNLHVGERVPFASSGFAVPVALLEPERCFVLHGDSRLDSNARPLVKPGEFVHVSWSFNLQPRAYNTTRFVERWRADWSPTLQNTLTYRLLLEPGAFMMERKTLLGIKQRAEALTADKPLPDLTGW